MHAQFRRAQEKVETSDLQLVLDLSLAVREKEVDMVVLKRLSEKLQLRTMNDLKRESLAIHDLVISGGSDPQNFLEEMSTLLKKLKDCALKENNNDDVGIIEVEKIPMKHRSPVIPDEFRCPISLELMKDPVIVSTGQVPFFYFHSELLNHMQICVWAQIITSSCSQLWMLSELSFLVCLLDVVLVCLCIFYDRLETINIYTILKIDHPSYTGVCVSKLLNYFCRHMKDHAYRSGSILDTGLAPRHSKPSCTQP